MCTTSVVWSIGSPNGLPSETPINVSIAHQISDFSYRRPREFTKHPLTVTDRVRMYFRLFRRLDRAQPNSKQSAMWWSTSGTLHFTVYCRSIHELAAGIHGASFVQIFPRVGVSYPGRHLGLKPQATVFWVHQNACRHTERLLCFSTAPLQVFSPTKATNWNHTSSLGAEHVRNSLKGPDVVYCFDEEEDVDVHSSDLEATCFVECRDQQKLDHHEHDHDH